MLSFFFYITESEYHHKKIDKEESDCDEGIIEITIYFNLQ